MTIEELKAFLYYNGWRCLDKVWYHDLCPNPCFIFEPQLDDTELSYEYAVEKMLHAGLQIEMYPGFTIHNPTAKAVIERVTADIAARREYKNEVTPYVERICECGAIKCGTSHSTWCPIYKPFK